MRQFQTNIITNFKYLEVHVPQDMIEASKTRLETIDAVRKINISSGHLIIYPNALYELNEVKDEVDAALKGLMEEVVSESTIEETEEVQDMLGNYMDSQLLYNQAIEKFRSGEYYRNGLDDLRLALEILLKSVLNKSGGLEKMDKPLSDYLKSKGSSTEVNNNLIQSLRYLCHYQNNHVKHDNGVNKDDVEFIVNQTNIIVRHVLKLETIKK